MGKQRKVNRVSLEWVDDRLFHLGEEEAYSGQYTYYHDNGERAEQSQVRNGLLHGDMSIWNEEGIKICEAEYQDGIKHGKVTLSYDNGQKKSEFCLNQGKREGKLLMWYENGNKKFEARYKEDREISGLDYERIVRRVKEQAENFWKRF